MNAPHWLPRLLILLCVALLLWMNWQWGAQQPLAHGGEIALIAALVVAFRWFRHTLQQWRSLLLSSLAGAATALLCWQLGLSQEVAALLPALCQGLLALLVWRTLRPGRIPAIQGIAEAMLNEPLPAPMVHYARSSTWRWVWAFALLGAVNAAACIQQGFDVRHALPMDALDLAVAGGLIVGEYFYRRWRYAMYETMSLVEFCTGLRRVHPLSILLP